MAFETKNLKVFKKFILPKNQIEKECVVELEGDADKILSSSANATALLCEVSDGEISYTAVLSTCVIYSTADLKIGTSNISCEFTGKIHNEEVRAGDKAIISLVVKEQVVSSENGKAVVGVTIEEAIEVFAERSVDSIDCDDEDVCLKNSTIKLNKFVGATKKECSCEEEIVARGNVKKIVALEPSVAIKAVEGQNGYVSVSGETITKISYLTTEDKFETNYISCPFKEEIEFEGCDGDSVVECKAVASFKDCVSEVLESDKGTKINVKTPFSLNVFACGEEEVSVVEDMYSTTNEVQMSSESFDMTKVCKSEILDTKIDGGLSLGEDKPRVDKILLCGGNNIVVTNAYVSGGELSVEGIAKTTVIYLNDDENALNSVEIEIPFVVSDKTNATDEASVCVDAVLYDCDVVVKKGRELFFDGKVKITARICEKEFSATIVGAQKGEAYGERDYAMTFVYGKEGESLWEVAKRNKVSQNQLIAQNGDIAFPLVQDTGFVLFYQKLM